MLILELIALRALKSRILAMSTFCHSNYLLYSRKCKIVKFYFALMAGSNRIKYLCQRVKMWEMWAARSAANKASGPGLGLEGRDESPGVRSHILTNRTLICQPSGPSLKFSVKSVTIQQTREKLRKFFQEMDQ